MNWLRRPLLLIGFCLAVVNLEIFSLSPALAQPDQAELTRIIHTFDRLLKLTTSAEPPEAIALTVDLPFNEVTRRVPSQVMTGIQSRLEHVTDAQLAYLEDFVQHPPDEFLAPGSIILHPQFSDIALGALKGKRITVFEFATLLLLHSFKGQEIASQFIAFYRVGELPGINPIAESMIIESSGYPRQLNNTRYPLILDQGITNSMGKIMGFWRNRVSPMERGFWFIAFKESKATQAMRTVSAAIRDLGGNVFFRLPPKRDEKVDDLAYEIIPSFSLMQFYLRATFGVQALELNPVLGESSLEDLRRGAILGVRDIGLPFADIPLPQNADGYPAPRAADFVQHDFYHAIIQSGIPPLERSIFLKLGDVFQALKEKFAQALLDRKQIPSESAETTRLQKIRRRMGQLKFHCWDMESSLSDDDTSRLLDHLEGLKQTVILAPEEIQYLKKVKATFESRLTD